MVAAPVIPEKISYYKKGRQAGRASAKNGVQLVVVSGITAITNISMTGYAVNNRFGAVCYNLFHHKGIAVLVYAVGFVAGLPSFELIGVVLFGHSSLDRIFGYGLKFSDSSKTPTLNRSVRNEHSILYFSFSS